MADKRMNASREYRKKNTMDHTRGIRRATIGRELRLLGNTTVVGDVKVDLSAYIAERLGMSLDGRSFGSIHLVREKREISLEVAAV